MPQHLSVMVDGSSAADDPVCGQGLFAELTVE
jgi:hypothetical protein